MKLRNLMWGACACALMAGCSNDDAGVDNGGNVMEKGGKVYAKVRIAMDNGMGSRAAEEGGYDYGTEEDHAIKSIYFGFYKADGSWEAEGKEVEEGSEMTPSGTPPGNVEAIIKDAVVALELDEGDTFPAQVIAYVNIPDATSQFKGKSIEEAKKIMSAGKVDDTSSGFPMTNSTYLSEGKEVIATVVSNTDFYESEDAAKECGHPVTIYVERLAAKITVENSQLKIDDIDANGHTLTFQPEGYSVSGTNTKEYYLKNIEENWGEWDWFNEETDHRCFWAEDPNYATMGSTKLDFCSYTEAAAVQPGTPQYCMENTLDSNLAETDAFEAYTHLLVVGKYAVKDAEGPSVELGDEEYLYMYAGTAYIGDDEIKGFLLDAAADDQLAWVKIGSSYEQADADAYKIVRVGDTKNTVTLELGNNGETYYRKTGESISDINGFNSGLKTYLTTNIGAPEAFKGGRAYFAVPIEHFGGTQTGGDGTGAIGVVRNHSYVLTVTQISGLGEGVFDPEEDIIPAPVKKKYYVAATLNVLSWKAVTQKVSFN